MADVFEEEAEPTVSIREYLKEVEEQELEADLVLGGDDGKECTYSKGYMKRQAIFSCLTCTPDGNAGVCIGCILSCHEGHDIVELWTKRNFRCDCGNSKFGEFFCKLSPDKDVTNEGNSYNHNFKGLYCTCNRPYPDPEVEEQVEMIQCCICEDWFHEEHIDVTSSDEVPRDDEGEPLYEDFICPVCSTRCSFLTLYPPSIWAADKQNDAANSIKEKRPENAEVECRSSGELGGSSSFLDTPVVEGSNMVSAALSENQSTALSSFVGGNSDTGTDMKKHIQVECGSSGELGCSSSFFETPIVQGSNMVSAATPENKTPTKSSFIGENSDTGVDMKKCIQGACLSTACILAVHIVEAAPFLEKGKPMFLFKAWRDALCKCKTCVNFYKEKGIDFLLDKDDSIAEYEKMAKLKRDENLQQQEGVEQNFLNKLGHVQKMEILSGIADMNNEIHKFLESFDSSKPITSADVHQIFENLAKKRRRV